MVTELDYPVGWSHYDVLYPKLHGSCNGLVCLEFDKGNMIIWNPCTREFKKLPQPELHVAEYIFGGDDYVCLAGFGYDSTVANYKVVRATSIYNSEPVNLQVLTLKLVHGGPFKTSTMSEKALGHGDTILYTRSSWLLNETLHWVGLSEVDILGIVTFGLADETRQVMSVFPYGPSSNRSVSTSLVTVGTSLLVYHEFGLYTMKEYGVQESWTRVMYISPDDLPEVVPQDLDYFNLRPISMLENGEALVSHRGSMRIYSPEERTFRCVLSDDYVDYYYSHNNVSYVETMVSPVVGIRVGESEMAGTVEYN